MIQNEICDKHCLSDDCNYDGGDYECALLAIITWLRMMNVKRHVIIKTITLMEEIVIVPMVAIITWLRMMNVKRHATMKTATTIEEIVIDPLVAIFYCLRIMSVKRHAIMKTATLMKDIVLNVPLVAIKS